MKKPPKDSANFRHRKMILKNLNFAIFDLHFQNDPKAQNFFMAVFILGLWPC